MGDHFRFGAESLVRGSAGVSPKTFAAMKNERSPTLTNAPDLAGETPASATGTVALAGTGDGGFCIWRCLK
jgi:hypothetical protein